MGGVCSAENDAADFKINIESGGARQKGGGQAKTGKPSSKGHPKKLSVVSNRRSSMDRNFGKLVKYKKYGDVGFKFKSDRAREPLYYMEMEAGPNVFASLEDLLADVLLADSGALLDSFRGALFDTLPYFTKAPIVMRAFASILTLPPPAEASQNDMETWIQLKFRTLETIDFWTQSSKEDVKIPVKKALVDAVTPFPPESWKPDTWAAQPRTSIEALGEAVEDVKKRMLELVDYVPPKMPYEVTPFVVPVNVSRFKKKPLLMLDGVSPRQFAEQFCIITHERMRCLTARQIYLRDKKDLLSLRTNQQLIADHNSTWVSSTILSPLCPKCINKRRRSSNCKACFKLIIKAFNWWVDAAVECLAERNFNSVFEILIGLKSSSITRLNIVDQLQKSARAKFCRILTLGKDDRNYENYRKAIAACKASPGASLMPMIPYFTVFMSKRVQYFEEMASKEGGFKWKAKRAPTDSRVSRDSMDSVMFGKANNVKIRNASSVSGIAPATTAINAISQPEESSRGSDTASKVDARAASQSVSKQSAAAEEDSSQSRDVAGSMSQNTTAAVRAASVSDKINEDAPDAKVAAADDTKDQYSRLSVGSRVPKRASVGPVEAGVRDVFHFDGKIAPVMVRFGYCMEIVHVIHDERTDHCTVSYSFESDAKLRKRISDSMMNRTLDAAKLGAVSESIKEEKRNEFVKQVQREEGLSNALKMDGHLDRKAKRVMAKLSGRK